MTKKPDPQRKSLEWVSSAKKDMQAMPSDVQDVFGRAILDAQYGDVPDGARPFGEGVRREVWKLVEDYDGDTYRAAYTVAFKKAVYVLDVFVKKSKRGISTPKMIRNRVEERFKAAERHYKDNYPNDPEQ